MYLPNKKIDPLQDRALRIYADQWGANWKLRLRIDWRAYAIQGVAPDVARVLLGLKEAAHFGTNGLDHWSTR